MYALERATNSVKLKNQALEIGIKDVNKQINDQASITNNDPKGKDHSTDEGGQENNKAVEQIKKDEGGGEERDESNGIAEENEQKEGGRASKVLKNSATEDQLEIAKDCEVSSNVENMTENNTKLRSDVNRALAAHTEAVKREKMAQQAIDDVQESKLYRVLGKA